jgi:hypothetical protein
MSRHEPVRLATRPELGELGKMLRAAQDVRPDPDVVARLAARLDLKTPGERASSARELAGNARVDRAAGVSIEAPIGAAKLVLVTSAVVAAALTIWLLTPAKSAHSTTSPARAVVSVAPANSDLPKSAAPPPPEAVTPLPAVSAPLPARSAAPAARSSEYALISEAERLRLSSPERALSLTDEHARLYPHGALSEERDVLAIEALVRLGRLPRARGLAERFAATYPGSAYRGRIERLIFSADQK